MARIIAVDDSASMRQMVTFTLKKSGYQVDDAQDGQAALQLAKQQQYDVVITDVNMPVMDGITLLQQLRQREDYQYTPVLMLTTETNPDLQAQAREYGVKAWLNKPLRPPVLQGAINKLI